MSAKGFDVRNNNQKLALKVESHICKGVKLLEKEKLILLALKKLSTKNRIDYECFPQIVDHGKTNEFSYFVADFLGISLSEFFKINATELGICHTHIIFSKILKCIENLHLLSFIHRDIKPSNLLISLQNETCFKVIIFFNLAL